MNASTPWLLIGALAMGCASVSQPAPRAVPAPTPAPQIPRVNASDGATVPWSRLWPLTWTDFQASAPSGGVEGAHTVYELTYEWQCRGNAFQYTVAAVFLPAQSWVKPTVVADPMESSRVLGHEQTHFNITEVYARRIREYLAELYNPCGQHEDTVRTVVDGYIADEGATQKQYDDETRYGLETARQHTWARDVAGLLTSLERFAAK